MSGIGSRVLVRCRVLLRLQRKFGFPLFLLQPPEFLVALAGDALVEELVVAVEPEQFLPFRGERSYEDFLAADFRSLEFALGCAALAAGLAR